MAQIQFLGRSLLRKLFFFLSTRSWSYFCIFNHGLNFEVECFLFSFLKFFATSRNEIMFATKYAVCVCLWKRSGRYGQSGTDPTVIRRWEVPSVWLTPGVHPGVKVQAQLSFLGTELPLCPTVAILIDSLKTMGVIKPITPLRTLRSHMQRERNIGEYNFLSAHLASSSLGK